MAVDVDLIQDITNNILNFFDFDWFNDVITDTQLLHLSDSLMTAIGA